MLNGSNLCCEYLLACVITGSKCMFSEEQLARPCNNYRSTGIRIQLLSSTLPIGDNVLRTRNKNETLPVKRKRSCVNTVSIYIFAIFPKFGSNRFIEYVFRIGNGISQNSMHIVNVNRFNGCSIDKHAADIVE